MTEIQNSKKYDLEDRTLKYSRNIISFTKVLPKTVSNTEIIKQLIRSSCSVGANYIEANESLGKKDFLMRIRICRKEAKESLYWLNLIENGEPDNEQYRFLLKETTELMKIFGSILEKFR